MDMRVDPLAADPTVAAKVRRLSAGGSPRVIDLFAGCGGISLGFQRAGFSIEAAVELDALAARSHALNFHNADPDTLEAHAEPRDITSLEPEQLCEQLGLGTAEEAVDVLVGGPPCQAYARVGRAKLREVADHPDAYKVDPRRNLYLRYIEWVRRLRPLALLMENVPDMLNQAGHNVAEEVVELLDGLGYTARYSLINTAYHGVPQMRDRVFLIAYRKELGVVPDFPAPIRHLDLPPGYAGTRTVALKYINQSGSDTYREPRPNQSLRFAVTAGEAIGDLPRIEGDSVRRGARRPGPDTFVRYPEITDISDYARDMRNNWPGFEAADGVVDHLIRYLPRDGAIFQHMEEGDEYPEANKVAQRLFKAEALRRGLRQETDEYRVLERERVPPYPTGTFPNRWWKLRRDFPARTLMAHLGKDCYSHIHYDGTQRRTISIREAARLQSFPDGFRFCGTMNPMLKQIGNAVPPLMAWEIAKVMKASLKKAVSQFVPSGVTTSLLWGRDHILPRRQIRLPHTAFAKR
jgi:DNA (cytosine-5)-methyltransferase 1